MPDPIVNWSMLVGEEILDQTDDPILDMMDDPIRDQNYAANTDVLWDPKPRFKQGMAGTGPLGLVAEPGELVFALDNSELNSAGIASYYSPDHANALSGFDVGLAILLRIEGTNVRYQKYYITDIQVQPGQYSPDRFTLVIASDYMNELLKNKITLVPVLLSKRDDQVLDEITGQLPFSPAATDYDAGVETYTYALHDERDEVSTFIRIAQKLMLSGFGQLFVTGNATTGETLTYRNRQSRSSGVVPVASLSGMMSAMVVDRSERSKIRRVECVAYPVEVDAAATTVLATLVREITIPAATTLDPEIFRYRDPNDRTSRVSGLSMVTPVISTDYKFGSATGLEDMNANLVATPAGGIFGGNSSSIIFQNTHPTNAGVLWFFQLRGKGIYLYDPVTKVAETPGATSGETLRVDMYYQDNTNVAQDLADILLAWFGDVETEVRTVEFVANTDQTLLDYAIEVQVGDAVTLQENQTGINSLYFVNQRQMVFDKAEHKVSMRWTLLRVPETAQEVFFTLDDLTYGVLDDDMLGY